MDALLIQIQGSARVRLEDGTMLRINYAAHNGYPNVPIGRFLVERNIIPREAISLDRIREWMSANPESAKEVLRQNPSFTFFRIVGLSDDREAVGAQGVPLTSGRSIAVDNALHVYGTPFFIQARLPLTNEKRSASFARLMIAQDTGSAIVGPARADIYFGAGDQAGRLAGRVHHSGTFAMLVPRELDPVVIGAPVPLPLERPPAAALVSARTPAPKSHIVCGMFGSPCAIAGRAEALWPDWSRKSLEQRFATRPPLSLRRQTPSPHQPSWSNLSAQ
jgi:membrane-bound lytic murein transglycosylase A